MLCVALGQVLALDYDVDFMQNNANKLVDATSRPVYEYHFGVYWESWISALVWLFVIIPMTGFVFYVYELRWSRNRRMEFSKKYL